MSDSAVLEAPTEASTVPPGLECQCGSQLDVPGDLIEEFLGNQEIVLLCNRCQKLSIINNQRVESQVDPLRITRWTESFY